MHSGGWRDERGSALVTVVGVLTVLAILVTGTLVVTQSNASLLRKRTDSMKAFYMAQAGLAAGESELLRDHAAGEEWTTDEGVVGENAHVVAPPIASLHEVEPRLSELLVSIEVVEDAGVYKIRSSATLSSGHDSTTASLAKYVVIQDDAGGGGVSPDLLLALSKSILSGGDLTLRNNAYVEGSVHSNGDVEVGNNAVMTLGYTDGDDFTMVVPALNDVTSYARVQAESVRSAYSGEWTSNPNDLTGNVHLEDDLLIGSNRVVHANLWVEGDLSVNNNSRIYGDLFVEGNLSLRNNVEIHGQLYVEGSLTLHNNVVVQGPVHVYGDPDDVGTVTLGNNVAIHSHVITSSDLIVRNNTTIRGSLLSEGSVQIDNNVSLGTDQYGSLVYADGNIVVHNNATIMIGGIVGHGWTRIDNNARVLQSGLGIDPSVFELFPSSGEPGIVDSYWGG